LAATIAIAACASGSRSAAGDAAFDAQTLGRCLDPKHTIIDFAPLREVLDPLQSARNRQGRWYELKLPVKVIDNPKLDAGYPPSLRPRELALHGAPPLTPPHRAAPARAIANRGAAELLARTAVAHAYALVVPIASNEPEAWSLVAASKTGDVAFVG